MPSRYHKGLRIALVIMLCLLTFSAAAETNAAVHAAIAGEIAVGQKLEMTFTLENAEELGEPVVEWKSSDADIAAVKKNTLTGKSVGSAQITCTVTFRNGMSFSDKAMVEVYAPVKSVALSEKALTLNVGETSEAVVLSVLPENAR